MSEPGLHCYTTEHTHRHYSDFLFRILTTNGMYFNDNTAVLMYDHVLISGHLLVQQCVLSIETTAHNVTFRKNILMKNEKYHAVLLHAMFRYLQMERL